MIQHARFLERATGSSMGREKPTLSGARELLRHVASGPAPGEREIIEALAERTAEMLSAEDFQVTTDGQTITIAGLGRLTGRTSVMTPFFAWRTPLSLEARLAHVMWSHASRLQEFVSEAYRAPWPAVDAEPHVKITRETVAIWWGGESEDCAVTRLRPMSRDELRVGRATS